VVSRSALDKAAFIEENKIGLSRCRVACHCQQHADQNCDPADSHVSFFFVVATRVQTGVSIRLPRKYRELQCFAKNLLEKGCEAVAHAQKIIPRELPDLGGAPQYPALVA